MARFRAHIHGHPSASRLADSEMRVTISGGVSGVEIDTYIETETDTDVFALYATRGQRPGERLFLGTVRLAEDGSSTFFPARTHQGRTLVEP